MAELEAEISQLIIDTLGLEDLMASEIDVAAPLFGDGLGLDSVDALELGLVLQKRYGIKIEAESQDTKQHFASVRSLAAFVAARQSR